MNSIIGKVPRTKTVSYTHLAEDLITVRGLKFLKQADIVIYAGSLVNPGLLKETKPVSYTHLDVYKRQVYDCVIGFRTGYNSDHA